MHNIVNVALYKPINFVSEFHYMSNVLTSEIPTKTVYNFKRSRRMTRK